jgi:hypothetical protein
VYSIYLPPETGIWGRDAPSFFNHILSACYLYSDVDYFVIGGDFNARIGENDDTVMGVDDIPVRMAIDHVSNQHGNALLEFLQESKMCVLNGRVQPENDNFTCVSARGSSVVDYVIVPHRSLKYCTQFHVRLANDVIEECHLTNLLGTRCKVPDHSFLQLSLNLGTRINLSDEPPDSNCHLQRKKFNRKKIPQDFMSNAEDRRLLLNLIENIEMCREQQTAVDEVYKRLTETLIGKMKEVDPAFDCPIKTRRRYRPIKPFWTEELSLLWSTMREKEKRYLKYQKHNTRHGREFTAFKMARNDFDRTYRRTERKYKRDQMTTIENVTSSDPKAFWEQLKKLGPRQRKEIPMEVVSNDGKVLTKHEEVLDHWKAEFEKLYAQTQENTDPEILRNAKQRVYQSELTFMDPLYETTHVNTLNRRITLGEVEHAVQRAKNGKATGPDQIPNEILKFPQIMETLHHLFGLCFDFHMTPSDWGASLIHPIYKNGDSRNPMNYRGISLTSVLAKLYSAILNNRLVKFLESNDILTEEQCGFRQNRACEDHLFTLHALIKKRMEEGKETFALFIDFRKAFDMVNRDLMLLKLIQLGIDGHFYFALKALYRKTWAQVRINDALTGSFETPNGVRQGDSLSPTLFISFVNDLSMRLRESPHSFDIGERQLNHLMYADDLVLLADNVASLQTLTNITAEWCNQWQLSINTKKTQAMHFRKKRKLRHDGQALHIGGEKIKFVDQYKYLGVTFDEHLAFSANVKTLAGSAGRALGSLIAKYKCNPNMGYATYTRLFQNCVAPILDYGAHITGGHVWKELEDVQARAERVFLGVHKFTAKAAITADMNWDSCYTRQQLQSIRFWNRLVNMPDSRIPRQIFQCEIEREGYWSSLWHRTLEEAGCSASFVSREPCNSEACLEALQQREWEKRREEFQNKPKLQLYSRLKSNRPGLETYLTTNLLPSERSVLAQLRSGTLPLAIETGRYTRTPKELRICPLCSNDIETEIHFVFDCPNFTTYRENMIRPFTPTAPNGNNQINHLDFLFHNHPRKLSKYLLQCLSIRKSSLYV